MNPPSTLEAMARASSLRPDSVALVAGAEHVTYAELERSSNRVAHQLRSRGVGPEGVVAIRMERGPALVVTIVGVLKSGAAYLPLDPRDPPARWQAILAAANCSLVASGDEAPKEHASTVASLRLSAGLVEGAEGSAGPILELAHPDNPAYVISTSGTTGAPKNVVLTHRALDNHMRWMLQAFAFGTEQRIVLKTALTFDASVWELLAPLMAGGLLIIANPGGERDPGYLHELILESEATTLQLVPSMLEACLALGALDALPSLNRLFCGGERLEEQTVAQLRASRPDIILYNLYGPTEATIDTTWAQATTSGSRRGAIGRPIDNVEVWLARATGEQVLAGDRGEIRIGGQGLARGFCGQPAATAERFLPDDSSGRAGARLYRSGDFGRWLEDGTLAFLGREDDQVKLRGFRIELGAIRAALRSHAAVGAVAVVARELAGAPALVAYVTSRHGGRLDVAELRASLVSSLPEYMLPGAIVVLEALPLTPHGKVDVRALPPPSTLEARGTSLARLEGPVERLLGEIWTTVLGVASPGPEDNFFQLGGDSIRSLKLISLAKQRGLKLSLQDIFRHQTIRSIATQCGATLGASSKCQLTQPFSLLAQDERQKLGAEVEDAFPMGAIQKALYFLNQTSARYEVYVTTLELEARFSAAALRTTLDLLSSRHAWLRTSCDVGGFREPMQIVRRASVIPFDVHDLTALAPEASCVAVFEWIDEQRTTRGRFEGESFLRVSAHLCAGNRFFLSFIEPVFDGWSVASMVSETLLIYHALLQGRAAPAMPVPSVTYRDFIALEREAVASPECEAFWRRTLDGWPPAQLPRCSGPRQGTVSKPIARQFVDIPGDVALALQRLASETSIPLKSILFAVHASVIGFICGRSVAVTGMMMNGRPEEVDADHLLGIFLNTVPVRLELEGSWLDLARAAFALETAALPYRRYPMTAMRTKFGVQPLFEAAFNFTHFHVFDTLKGLEGLSVRQYIAWDQTFFPFIAQFHQDVFSGRLMLALDYDAAEFSETLVRSWAGYYGEALRQMARHPNEQQQACSLVPRDERLERVRTWSGAPLSAGEIGSLSQRLADQAWRSPDAIALASGDVQLSYRELERRYQHLARRLKALGVGVESRVAVCVAPSERLVIALLGVLAVGAAYVPIDPSLPRRRSEFLIGDSGARALICDAENRERVGASGLAMLVLSDESDDADVGGPVLPCDLPGAAAYVLYTSGSSGTPKGVIVSRLALANFLVSISTILDVRATDVLLATTSISFDIAGLELLAPLLAGARLIVLDGPTVSDGFRLVNAIGEFSPTLMQGTPSKWRLLLDAGFEGSARLRLLCGGEKLDRGLADALSMRSEELWNLYGPTEATIWSSAQRVTQGGEEVTLGSPLANTRLHVLTTRFGLAPRCATRGELHIGGLGLARGYSGRQDLTAEAFVPSELAAEEGGRLYRTGDLAYHTESGQLAYAGRRDHQIKLRGVRIELAEVESVVASFPGIVQTVVQVISSPGGNAQLACYAVLASRHPGIWTELKAFLRERLAEAMVPTHYVAVERIPLTHNGKVDRRALPDPFAGNAGSAEAAERGSSFRQRVDRLSSERRELLDFFAAGRDRDSARGEEPPRQGSEQTLARIWADVLGISNVTRHDDFFALGGDSISIIQVVAMARREGLPIGVHDIFGRPTLAGLAPLMEAPSSAAPAPETAHIGPTPPHIGLAPNELGPGPSRDDDVEDVYPLSPMQEGILYRVLSAPASSPYTVQWAFDVEGDFNVGGFERSWEICSKRHPVLRTAIRWVGREEPAQVVLARAGKAIRYEDWSEVTDVNARLISARERDRHAPFDLGAPPLVRIAVYRLAAHRHHVIWSHHHIILDGWSQQLLLEQMAALYGASMRDSDPAPVPAASYKQFVRWAAAADSVALRAYWNKELQGARTAFRQPSARGERCDASAGRREVSTIALSEASTAKLSVFAKRRALTLSVLVHAAWSLLWRAQTGRDEVAYGVTLSGRSGALAGLDSIVGLLINTLPMVVRVPRRAPLLAWLSELMQKQSGLIAHELTPLSLVRECAHVTGNAPLFESIVVFENLREPALDAFRRAGLAVSGLFVQVDEAQPLVLVVKPGRRLALELKYDTSRLSGSEAGDALAFIGYALEELPDLIEGEEVAAYQARIDERLSLFQAERRKQRRVSPVGQPRSVERKGSS